MIYTNVVYDSIIIILSYGLIMVLDIRVLIKEETYLKYRASFSSMGKILIVDDDEEFCYSLKEILQSHNHIVSAACDGESALEELSMRKFDLVIVDLKLGDMSGLDIVDTMARKYPDIITIILTGYASLDSAVEALRLGAYDYLQKPVNPEFLMNTIKRGLERQHLKRLNETIVNRMEEGLVLLDSQGIISFANSQFNDMLKHSYEEIYGRPFTDFVSPEDEDSLLKCLDKVRRGDFQQSEVTLVRKDGRGFIALQNSMNLGDHLLIMINDISETRPPQIAGADFPFKVEPGFLYLIKEEKPKESFEVFAELVRIGYKGTLITRKHPEELDHRFENVHFLRLTKELSDIKLIERKVETFLTLNRVILVECLDYIISNNSYDNVLNSIQTIRDLIFSRKSIMLLSIDPRTLSEREISLIEKETRPLLSLAQPRLREDLLELLTYVAKRNEVGAKPHHKEIQKRFNITRTTVRERLNLLNEKGLIIENRRGRTRVIEITEKGRKSLILQTGE
jgi:PAS domain S-box-containing protein